MSFFPSNESNSDKIAKQRAYYQQLAEQVKEQQQMKQLNDQDDNSLPKINGSNENTNPAQRNKILDSNSKVLKPQPPEAIQKLPPPRGYIEERSSFVEEAPADDIDLVKQATIRLSGKVNTNTSRIDAISEHLSKVSRGIVAEEAARMNSETTFRYLVREIQDKFSSDMDEMKQAILGKISRTDSNVEKVSSEVNELKQSIESIKAKVDAPKGNDNYKYVGAAGVDMQTIEAMASKLASLTRELDHYKENNAKLSNEVSGLRAQISTDQLGYIAANQELKSVVSAEITARRKGTSKMIADLDKLTILQADNASSMKKELMLLAEDFGSRLISNERGVSLMNNQISNEILHMKEFSKNNLQSLNNEMYELRRHVQDVKQSANQDSKHEAMIAKLSGAIDDIKLQLDGDNNLLREYVEEMYLKADTKAVNDINSFKAQVNLKLFEIEQLVDTSMKQVLIDVSEEIAASIVEESDKRTEQINAAEVKAMESIIAITKPIRDEMITIAKATSNKFSVETSKRQEIIEKLLNVIQDTVQSVPSAAMISLSQLNKTVNADDLSINDASMNVEEEMHVAATKLQGQFRKGLAKKRVVEIRKEKDTAAGGALNTKPEPTVAEDAAEELLNVDEATPEQIESATKLQSQIRKNQSKKRVEELRKEKDTAAGGATTEGDGVGAVDTVVVAEDAAEELLNVDEATPEQIESATKLQSQIRKNQSKKRVEELRKEKDTAVVAEDAAETSESVQESTSSS